MNTALELSRKVGIKPACDALNLNRASFYRAQQPPPTGIAERPRPPLALSSIDKAPSQAHRSQVPFGNAVLTALRSVRQQQANLSRSSRPVRFLLGDLNA